ncbi:MAG: OmpA family protein [Deltaproteobacteria bacterium]|nr:OmpA family protein [Deltaproteobacteria bacterium]
MIERHLTGRTVLAVGVALMVCLGSVTPAHADNTVDDGLMADTRLFKPAVDSKGLFTVNASPILPHLGLSFGLVLDYANSIFRLEEGNEIADGAPIIDNAVWGTLAFNIGIANWMVLGLQLPIGVLGGPVLERDRNEDGILDDDIVGGDFSEGMADAQGLGNLAIHAKIRFLRVELMPVGLAAVVQIGLPTVASKNKSFMGDPYGNATILAVLDKWFGRRVKLAVNLGFKMSFGAFAGKGMELSGLPGGGSFSYGHSLLWGVGAAFGLVADKLDFVLEYFGNLNVSNMKNMGDTGLQSVPMEIGAGFKVFVEQNSYLYLGGGFGGFKSVMNGYSAPSWRFFAAFIFEPSIGDRDGDGIKDDVDQCPDDPEDRDNFEDVDGCPDPDNDRDGILDVDDDCPNVPEDRDGDQDEDGCPEGAEGDRDGDGILDDVDSCPDDPEDLDGFEDKEGCPDPDNDQDTILDVDDLCPNDPEDPDGFEDINGCPDPDNDADRILDVDDACPNDPETYNGFEDEDGCPDKGKVEIKGSEIVIMDKVYFETDSAEIKPESFEILDAVAATVIGNPQIVHVQIQGHADERASNDYNIQLTHERAASVVKYLVDKGVEEERLTSAGYGEECPVDKAHNAKAWDKNRRVEFKILETTDGCTGVDIACQKAIALGLVPPEDEKFLPGGGYCD